MSDRQEMLELFGVPDVYVSGMGAVESIGGGNHRFTFYAYQDVHGRQELVVVAKLIMNIEALPDTIRMASLGTNTCACENARRMVRN